MTINVWIGIRAGKNAEKLIRNDDIKEGENYYGKIQ